MKLSKNILIITLLFSIQVNATIYEDAEDERTNRWQVYDNTPVGATIDNVYLQDRDQNAIEFKGSGTSNGYILGNWEGRLGAWNNTKEHTLKWSMNFDEGYTVYVRIMTKEGARYIYYTASDESYGKRNNEYIHIGLGSKSNNGTWQDFSRDLASDLRKYEPNNKLIAVNAFLIRGNGMVDDIELVDMNRNIIESINAESDKDTLILSLNGSFEVGSHGSFFIDADNDTSTGYSNNIVKGADYLAEEKILYQYVGNRKNWKWDKISYEIITEKSSTLISSKIPLHMMDIGNQINYLSGVTTSDWKQNIKYDRMEEYYLSDMIDSSITIGAIPIKSTAISKGTLFASPNAHGDCSKVNPCGIYMAFSRVKFGDILFLRGGTYKLNKSLILRGIKGTLNKPIIIESYPNEKVVLDGGETIKHINNNENIVKEGIKISGNSEYVYIRKLEIKNIGGGGIFIEYSSHNVIEGCIIHHNHNGGINVYGGANGQGGNDYIPYTHGYNILQNNIIYSNSDVGIGSMNNKLIRGIYGYANGNNSDGISITSGKENKIINNTIYSNSDDGIDVWRSNDSYISHNIVYDNGDGEGDGNGIKTGGNLDKNVDNGARAVVEYNIAYNNKVNGFDYNFGKQVKMQYNTSYHNGNNGFRSGGDAYISHNIASNNKYNSNLKGIQEHNSWDINNNVSYLSTTPQTKDFLKPKVGSEFENMGAYAK